MEEASGLRLEEMNVDEKAREKSVTDLDLNRQMQELAKDKKVMLERHNVLELLLDLEKSRDNNNLENDKKEEEEETEEEEIISK